MIEERVERLLFTKHHYELRVTPRSAVAAVAVAQKMLGPLPLGPGISSIVHPRALSLLSRLVDRGVAARPGEEVASEQEVSSIYT